VYEEILGSMLAHADQLAIIDEQPEVKSLGMAISRLDKDLNALKFLRTDLNTRKKELNLSRKFVK